MHLIKFYVNRFCFYKIPYCICILVLIIKEVQEDIEHDIKFSWVQSDKKKVAEREATPVVRIVCVV